MLGHGLTTPQMGPMQHPMNPPVMQPGHGMLSPQMQQVRPISRSCYSCAFRLTMVSCPAVPTSHAKHFQVPEHAPIYDVSSDNRTTRPRHGSAVAPAIRGDTDEVEPTASPSATTGSEPQPAISPRANVPREHHGVHKHDRIGAHGRGRRRLRAGLRGVVQPRPWARAVMGLPECGAVRVYQSRRAGGGGADGRIVRLGHGTS